MRRTKRRINAKNEENIELNKKNEEELINMYNEKIKILEENHKRIMSQYD